MRIKSHPQLPYIVVIDLFQRFIEKIQFNQPSEIIDLLNLLKADSCGIVSPIGFMADQLLELQPFECLNDRCLTHPQPLGEIPIGYFLARHNLVMKHHITNAVISQFCMAFGSVFMIYYRLFSFHEYLLF